ncbi:response regulator FixJ [Pseudoroseomonas ludipueritiae]|uniref:Response regulator n=1 Tax=Pseudoroseomonas ludipueritiae TaxID=198093 RepID=A0ABR7RB04_9PROT|nr:response regulator FixJ [Pseudoroseomonas ludipueritiae]MBC9178975.1 response regulator [Pseudoroseomonas ludipueritiae]MCG7359944.1 response regulator [Roseomonas sp. ACRSG]
MKPEAPVHVIDDDEAVRDSLGLLLASAGHEVVLHESAANFLSVAAPGACVVSDVRMPEMDGLALQQELAQRGIPVQLIFMTGHGDVPVAVRALKAGAMDFLEKPFAEEALLAAVRGALEAGQARQEETRQREDIRRRLDSLTPREREVLDGLVAGQANKAIAQDLGMSPRTVEVHRARVMEKMGAQSLSHLVRQTLAATGKA